jgi:hypothetical protein
MAGSTLPEALNLGKLPAPRRRKAARRPVQTVITSAGPGVFEYDTDVGHHRATFRREVVVKNRVVGGDGKERRLDCDRLDVWLRARGAAGSGDGPGIEATTAAAAAPGMLPATTRWLTAALGPLPGRKPVARTAPAKGGKQRKEVAHVDLVVARGAVKVKTPEGEARGALLWYDHPAGILWLEPAPGEKAELVRPGEGQSLARRFFYDVRTGRMRAEGITVTLEP